MTAEEYLKWKCDNHPQMYDECGHPHRAGMVYVLDAQKAVEMAKKETTNNAWHNANEIPQTGKTALVVFENESLPITYTGRSEDWKYLGHIWRWAYVEDLLPI